MCQVVISNVQGNVTTSGVNLLVEGTSSECEQVKIRIHINGNWIVSPVTINSQSGNWQYTFQGLNIECGSSYEIEAYCVDNNGDQLPLCQSGFWSDPISCESECCVEFSVDTIIGSCNSQGKIPVTFDVSFVINDTSCLPYVLHIDFGDTTNSPPQFFNTLGSHTFSVTHLYDPAVSLNYVAQIIQTNPANCQSQFIQVDLIPCPPDDCCPISNVEVNIKECNDKCEREVEITTSFLPQSNCSAGFVQWIFEDQNGVPIPTLSLGFLSNTTNTQTFYFSSHQSPVKATLITTSPIGCADVVHSVIIPECDSPPVCPIINFFNVEVLDCIEIGNSCCRKVKFTLDAFFDLGCGTQQKPELQLDFGDNSQPETRIIVYGGNQQLIFDHEYCTSGNYTATLKVAYPNDCPEISIPVVISVCEQDDPVCPIISIDRVEISDCKDDCKREVELFLNIHNPNPCSIPGTFHIEWGDGERHPNSSSGNLLAPNSPYTTPYSHEYSAGQSYTITIKVDTPSGCADITHTVNIPECDECKPPCEEKGWLSWLCPTFQAMMIGGLGLGILWLILSICLPVLPASVGLIILGVGVLGLLLYWWCCKCKPCGWLYLLLWKLLLGIGIMLLIFGKCCSLWIYGILLILLGILFLFLWKNKCEPSRCEILGELSLMWTTILVPAYGYVIVYSTIANCQLTILSVSVYWLMTLIFAIILLMYSSCSRASSS